MVVLAIKHAEFGSVDVFALVSFGQVTVFSIYVNQIVSSRAILIYTAI